MSKIGYVLVIAGVILIIVGILQPSITQYQIQNGEGRLSAYIVGGIFSIIAGAIGIFIDKTT